MSNTLPGGFGLVAKSLCRFSLVAALVTLVTPSRASAQDPALAGRWDATVVVNRIEIPFVFEITGAGATLKGSFFNGERRITSTGSRSENGVLILSFDQLGTRLQIASRDGQLTGEYQRGGTRAPYPFKATRATTTSRPAAGAPQIAGTWILAARSSKGETAWRFIATQKGADVEATILRVDGDTGSLTGTWRDGKYLLSHFSGARPLVLEVTLVDAATLHLRQNGTTEFTAVRADAPKAKDVGEPTDPAHHTTVRNPLEPFTFSFPDLNGKLVSNTDARFAGKVMMVNISGSWCPNCHDEAPFLSALYKKYQARGLEVVALSFEEGPDLANPARLRAFIKEYGIAYTVLLPGEPGQLNEKVPQGVNLDAFPTTFFVGRDGLVRGVHAGFPSPGSADYYTKAEQEVTSLVEKLLAERAPAAR